MRLLLTLQSAVLTMTSQKHNRAFALLQEPAAAPVRRGPALRKYKVDIQGLFKHVLQKVRLTVYIRTLVTSHCPSPLQTLPPICTSDRWEPASTVFNATTRAERRAPRETAKVRRRPEPPRPTLLHMRVTAHSHALLEYLARFPDQFNKHFR